MKKYKEKNQKVYSFQISILQVMSHYPGGSVPEPQWIKKKSVKKYL